MSWIYLFLFFILFFIFYLLFQDSSEFDVVTCFNNRMTIHDARMHNDMIRMYMDHHEFEFDRVFNETATNSLVYKETAEPLVDYALEGGYSTCIVYGQTGSGKTFTMTSIYSQAARDIFDKYALSLSHIYSRIPFIQTYKRRCRTCLTSGIQ